MTSKPALACAAALAALVGCAAPAHAQNLNDQGICPGVQVYGENIPVRLMRVSASVPRVHFIDDTLSKPKASCPSSGPECQRKGFVVPGDEVLAGWTKGAFVCTVYVSPNAKLVKGQYPETNGYLPATALQEIPVPPASFADWQGKWTRSAEAEITITPGEGGKLKLAGQASWGTFDPGASSVAQCKGVKSRARQHRWATCWLSVRITRTRRSRLPRIARNAAPDFNVLVAISWWKTAWAAAASMSALPGSMSG
jgi:hypothetical protein